MNKANEIEQIVQSGIMTTTDTIYDANLNETQEDINNKISSFTDNQLDIIEKLKKQIENILIELNAKSYSLTGVEYDIYPTKNSSKLVRSNGIYQYVNDNILKYSKLLDRLNSEIITINNNNAGIGSIYIDNGKLIKVDTNTIKKYENLVNIANIKVQFTKDKANWKSISITRNIVSLNGYKIEYSIGNISSEVPYKDNRKIALIQKDIKGTEITRTYGNTICSDTINDNTAMLTFIIYYSKENQLTEDVELTVSDIQCRILYNERLYERLNLINNYVDVSFHDVIKTHNVIEENNLANINTGIIYTTKSLIFVSDKQWASTLFLFSPKEEMKGKELYIECNASTNVYKKYIRLRQLLADGNEIKQLMGVSPLHDIIDEKCAQIEIRFIGSWNNAVSGNDETYRFNNLKIYFVDKKQEQESPQKPTEDNFNKGDIIALYPKEKITPILSGFRYKAGEVNNMYKCFTLLWFSDLHSVDRRLTRIRQFYDTYSAYLTDVVSTGDACHTYFQNFTYWTSCKANSFLNIMGNHEMFGLKQQYTLTNEDTAKKIISKYTNAWTVPGYSQKQCYKKFIKPFLNDTGIICQENKTYWYKDYINDNIRIIGLDMYHWKEKISCTIEYAEDTGKAKENSLMTVYPDNELVDTGEQLVWLQSILEDARIKGYQVICLRHSPNINKGIKCTFTNLYYDTQGCPNNEDLQAVNEFINKGGNFICWLTGHTHADMVGVHSDYQNQIQFAIDTSGALRQPNTPWDFTGNFSRIENTFSDDLFNIISIDVHNKWITLYRIGCNVDHQGRHIRSLVYDYGNMKMIHND